VTRSGEAPDDNCQKCAVTSAAREAGGTAGEVPPDRGGLFRRKLPVKIFPESINDLWTIH
jgi:hypothetical protein